MLIQACLGLEVDAGSSTLSMLDARLPVFLDHLRVENLSVGDASVDVVIQRQRSGVGVEVLERRGNVTVVNVK